MNTVEALGACFSDEQQNGNIRACCNFRLEIINSGSVYGRALDDLKERIAGIYRRGFDLGIMQTAEEVERSIGDSSIFIVSNAEGEDIAFSAQRIMRMPIPVDDRGSERWVRALYTSTRLVLPEYQDQNAGRFTMRVQDNEYRPDYFVGRSQNPAIHLGWKSLPFIGEDRPIDRNFTGEDLRSKQFRAIMWGVVTRTSPRKPVDINTGLAKYVYKEGETKGFIPDLSNERYAEIDARMKALGLVREDGDTLYYVIERINPQTEEQSVVA